LAGSVCTTTRIAHIATKAVGQSRVARRWQRRQRGGIKIPSVDEGIVGERKRLKEAKCTDRIQSYLDSVTCGCAFQYYNMKISKPNATCTANISNKLIRSEPPSHPHSHTVVMPNHNLIQHLHNTTLLIGPPEIPEGNSCKSALFSMEIPQGSIFRVVCQLWIRVVGFCGV